MQPRGRGRARGRAESNRGQEPRPGPPQQQQQQGGGGPPGGNRPRGGRQQRPAPAQDAPGPSPWSGGGARQQMEGGPSQREMAPPMQTPRHTVTGTGEGSGNERGGGNGGVRGRSLRSEILFTRPKHAENKQGTSGTPIELSVNYFKLVMGTGKWGLNQYRVDFSPDIDLTRQRRILLGTAIKDTLSGYLFDGTVLYTPHVINPNPLEKMVQTENGDNIRVTVRHVGDVMWGDYHYIQLFNLIIRRCLRFMNFQLVGREYYDPQSKIAIRDHNIELWPGYYTSMRQHEEHILLNCDVSFKFMRMDTIYDVLMSCASANVKQEFSSKVIGSVALTSYNNKTYRIDDVDFSLNPNYTFSMRDGRQMSLIEYYKTKYNIKITVESQPLLVSRSRPREIRAGMPETVFLIPELCQLTGLTDRQRENFQLMKSIAVHTRVRPLDRVAKLNEFCKRLGACKEAVAEVKKWNLNINNDLVKVMGRVLPPETIYCGNNVKFPSGKFGDWTMDLRSVPMFQLGHMKRFAVVCPNRLKGNCIEFMKQLQRAGQGMQFDLSNNRIYDIPDDRTGTYLEKIEGIVNNENPTLVMCILSNNSADRYNAIKKKCLVDRGVPSQIIVGRTMVPKGPGGNVMSVATKVAIQLNCKVGGGPWTVAMPLANLMVVGYDVCRDTANRGRCFAGMVASLDKQLTRYYNQVSEHANEEELSENFAAFLLLACKKSKELNGKYPDRILIYRDGVGDGQIPFVVDQEIKNIKKRLKEEIYTDSELKLAFIIVSKRINTRIFTARNPDNPPPGTVVDNVVTLPERYDFYIVSQCVRQGTVAPTSYNIIEDSMGLAPDKLQILTYKMCHLYYNLSGTIRVPAPCQYAHKLAFLTAQSLHRPAHRDLETSLYYL